MINGRDVRLLMAMGGAVSDVPFSASTLQAMPKLLECYAPIDGWRARPLRDGLKVAGGFTAPLTAATYQALLEFAFGWKTRGGIRLANLDRSVAAGFSEYCGDMAMDLGLCRCKAFELRIERG